jgi:hypothetical protein
MKPPPYAAQLVPLKESGWLTMARVVFVRKERWGVVERREKREE